MRRFIIFALLFGAGLFALLKFDKKNQGEGTGTDTELAGTGDAESGDVGPGQAAESDPNTALVDEPKTTPEDNTPAAGSGDSNPTGEGDPAAPVRPASSGDQGPVYSISGKCEFNKFDPETGQLLFTFTAEDAQPIGDPRDFLYRLEGVTIRARDKETAADKESLVLQADSATGKLEFDKSTGMPGGLSDGGLLEMKTVTVDVLEGHPMAPFELTGDEMTVRLDLGKFRGGGERPVELVGNGIKAKGWNLDMDRSAGLVHFLGGGEFEAELEDGGMARFETEEGTPLRLNRSEIDGIVRFQAHIDGGGTMVLTGTEAWNLNARGMSLQAVRRGEGKMVLERVDAEGAIEARRGEMVFGGSGARLVRLADTDTLDFEVKDNPKADLTLEDQEGNLQMIQIRGKGPMVVHAESTEGAAEQGEVQFKNSGSVVFPSEGVEALVEFNDGLDFWIDRINRSGTFRASGHVHLSQGEAWLRTQVLDSIVWSADQKAVDLVCEGPTQARLIDPDNGQLDFASEGGAQVQVLGEQWTVPKASQVHATQIGDEPVELRADELRDLDWARRSFHAWGNVAVQNELGSMQCERVESENPNHLMMTGREGSPVVLDLLAGSAISPDVFSGTLRAHRFDLRKDRIDCEGDVAADLRLRQGRLQQSGDTFGLHLIEGGEEDLSFQVKSEGHCTVDWSVDGVEQLHAECVKFDLEGTAPKGLLPDQNLPLVAQANPYTIEASGVSDMRWNWNGEKLEMSCSQLTTAGNVWIGATEQRVEPHGLRADDGVDLTASGALKAQATAKTLILTEGQRSMQLIPHEDENIVITGLLPKLALPYRLQCRGLDISEDRLEALEPEFKIGVVIFPNDGEATAKPTETSVRAGRTLVTEQGIQFSDGVFASGTDMTGVPLSIRSESLTLKGDVRRGLEMDASLGAMERLEVEGGFQIVYGGLARARGREMVALPTSVLLKGDSQQRVRVELADIDIETERMEVNLKDFLVKTTRGVMRGGGKVGQWALDYASLEPIKREGDTMFAIASPVFTEGKRNATANWAMAWIHPDAWQQRGRAALWGEPLPEERQWQPTSDEGEYRPDAIEELISSMGNQQLPHYLRALLMEGNVEASVAGRRLARADSMYLDVDGLECSLTNAELSRVLRLNGKDHKLRIKTEELIAESDGSMHADSATLTTCDHDVPHYVIETKDLKLIPRQDQRWRFSAEHNRVAFQNGMGLPMPSIRNIVLDETGGFEGFENEQGEVTTVDNIVLRNTPRFGTSLGTNLAYDIDKVGKFFARLFQFDTDVARGKWKVDGSYLSSRGPLLGLGLLLREPGREKANREEFWLDMYIRGIPDDGEDKGILRVPESETDSLRTWFSARGRYPFDDREWVDVVFNTQTDPGVQAEFYQNEYQRFEERDSYVHWRKARDGHYFQATAEWQQDSYRTVLEKLPAVGATRGLMELFRIGNVPINYSASADVARLQRREGDSRFERLFFDENGSPDGLGDRSVTRADTTHRLEANLPLTLPGTSLTPFAEARFTAWDKDEADMDSPSRFVSRAGARLQSLFTQTKGSSYHTLIPRATFAANVGLEQEGGTVVGFDEVEYSQDGDFSEVGLRSFWSRPDLKRWLDFDVALQSRTNRDFGLPDSQELRFLGGFRTEVGGIPTGIEHDMRQDMEIDRTIYSRSVFAVRPTEDLLMQFGHQRGHEPTRATIFETASLDMRYRINEKWELGATNYTSIKGGGNLQSAFTLRRFSHDFVLELEVTHFAGEGGTGFGINLVPLLAWKPSRLGILDQ